MSGSPSLRKASACAGNPPGVAFPGAGRTPFKPGAGGVGTGTGGLGAVEEAAGSTRLKPAASSFLMALFTFAVAFTAIMPRISSSVNE